MDSENSLLEQVYQDVCTTLGESLLDTIGMPGKDREQVLKDIIQALLKRLEAERKELSRIKEEYNNLFQYAPCYITVQDKNFRLVRFNHEFAQQFEAKEGDFCYTAYKGRTTRCERCPVVKTFKDGKPHFSEEVGVKKNGTTSYWLVRTAPIKDESGEIVAAMEMCIDVTQMKHLEAEIRKSEKKYRNFFSTIPNPVFVLDKETLNILDCNNSVVQTYGYSKDELLMTSFLNLCDENEREHLASELRDSNVLNQRRQFRKDGEIIYVNIRTSQSEYEGNNVLLVTTSDITERLEAEQQLIQASKMATLGEMATGVAHELNQPLTVIKTASSFLKKKTSKKEKIDESILRTIASEIDSQVDRATRIINHMREFGRKAEVKTKPTQVNEALRNALDFFNQQLKVRGIEVVEELDENLPLILADLNRLEQVFVNLLINARDAIEEKCGSIENRKCERRIHIRTYASGNNVVIEIADTGIGISSSVRDRIFEPFFTTKKVGKGTGLGLSISYGIVKDYNGTIEVHTKKGEGTTFVITFPIPERL